MAALFQATFLMDFCKWKYMNFEQNSDRTNLSHFGGGLGNVWKDVKWYKHCNWGDSSVYCNVIRLRQDDAYLQSQREYYFVIVPDIALRPRGRYTYILSNETN